MTTASFNDYLAQLKSTHDEQGDFVRLAKADGEMPEVELWAEFEAYLVSRMATYTMLDTARDVWSKYQKAVKKALNA